MLLGLSPYHHPQFFFYLHLSAWRLHQQNDPRMLITPQMATYEAVHIPNINIQIKREFTALSCTSDRRRDVYKSRVIYTDLYRRPAVGREISVWIMRYSSRTERDCRGDTCRLNHRRPWWFFTHVHYEWWMAKHTCFQATLKNRTELWSFLAWSRGFYRNNAKVRSTSDAFS